MKRILFSGLLIVSFAACKKEYTPALLPNNCGVIIAVEQPVNARLFTAKATVKFSDGEVIEVTLDRPRVGATYCR